MPRPPMSKWMSESILTVQLFWPQCFAEIFPCPEPHYLRVWIMNAGSVDAVLQCMSEIAEAVNDGSLRPRDESSVGRLISKTLRDLKQSTLPQ
jgi:hypothetical protein